jgi:predicted MPP superfamily phosphohydrolase
MFHLTFALPALYVLARFVWPLPWAPGGKIILAVVLLVASQYHLWSRLSSGSVFSPEFPRAVVLLFNWAFGAIALLAVMQIALDLTVLVARLVQGHGAIPDSVRYTVATAAMLLSAVGVYQATRVPPLKDVEFAIPGLPPQFDGYWLLQLTDLHISRLFPREWTKAVVERSNALGVDLIVVTGDLIDGSFGARRADVAPLRDLRAKDGVWVIPGNHEYFFGYEEWMLQYASLGMQALANDHVVLTRDGGSLVLAGVTDLSAPRSFHPAPVLSAALAGAPSDTPIILLDHQPRNAAQAAAHGVALQLSGHTHGGMVPGLDGLVARQQRLRLGPIPSWGHDALRQQRHGVVARLRSEARALVRTDPHHPATRVTAGCVGMAPWSRGNLTNLSHCVTHPGGSGFGTSETKA